MGIRGKELSAVEVGEVIRLRVVGMPVREVARELGIHLETVCKYAPLRTVLDLTVGREKRAKLRAAIRREERRSKGRDGGDR